MRMWAKGQMRKTKFSNLWKRKFKNDCRRINHSEVGGRKLSPGQKEGQPEPSEAPPQWLTSACDAFPSTSSTTSPNNTIIWELRIQMCGSMREIITFEPLYPWLKGWPDAVQEGCRVNNKRLFYCWFFCPKTSQRDLWIFYRVILG